jgi:hypothetical protein
MYGPIKDVNITSGFTWVRLTKSKGQSARYRTPSAFQASFSDSLTAFSAA